MQRKYMFSYRLIGGLCGNFVTSSLLDLGKRANDFLKHVTSFSIFYYEDENSSVSLLHELER